MCNFHEIFTYNCGHEIFTSKTVRSTFCFFDVKNICTKELGKFRILEEHVDDWCPRCAPIAQQMWQRRDQTGCFETPFATPIELQQQSAARLALATQQHVPKHGPGDQRLLHLNGLARSWVRKHLARRDSYATSHLVWVLRYIASLPAWLDRRALAAMMCPRFGDLLHEQAQICVRPAMRNMQCEDYLDSLMVWVET